MGLRGEDLPSARLTPQIARHRGSGEGWGVPRQFFPFNPTPSSPTLLNLVESGKTVNVLGGGGGWAVFSVTRAARTQGPWPPGEHASGHLRFPETDGL